MSQSEGENWYVLELIWKHLSCSLFLFSLFFLSLFGDLVITAWASSSSLVSVLWFLSVFVVPFSSFLTPFSNTMQVLGQLHGGRPWRFHERKPSHRHAYHHTSQEVHCTHSHHLSLGQKTQISLPPTHGGGRRPGQSPDRGRTCWGSVPWVRRLWGLFVLNTFILLSTEIHFTGNILSFSPVIVEIPHFGSMRGKERELIVLRSDNGDTWREHQFDIRVEDLTVLLAGMDEGKRKSRVWCIPQNQMVNSDSWRCPCLHRSWPKSLKVSHA